MGDWQDISTAPMDGTEILVCGPEYDVGPAQFVTIARFHGHWRELGDPHGELYQPTHWMPLPSPPVTP